MDIPAITAPTMVWLRRDLRLTDQPALAAALAAGGPILPVFIWAPEEEAPWAPGAASRWWLHHALADYDAQLRACGSRLILRAGPSLETLLDLATQSGAKKVCWNTLPEPAAQKRDVAVAAGLRAQGLRVELFSGALLFNHETILNQSGKPFQVFTAFWRRCLAAPPPPPPKKLPLGGLARRAPRRWPKSAPLQSLGLLPRGHWDQGFYTAWEPTLTGAQKRMRKLQKHSIARYATTRDTPGKDGTSRFSPYLHFGQISPRQAWRAGAASKKFLAELGWREFAHYLLRHFPQMPARPLREEFLRFPWPRRAGFLRAWQRGRTGYPLVDAGMRELWQTGWMHNRVRMVCASFLVKHLRQPWTDGAAWFWDTLVDADLANNAMGWQWVAGCGADAAPYFRVFNPTLQGERFDPDGEYVRRYVPELAKLPAAFIHAPWRAPQEVLREAGVILGKNYSRPMVEHESARRNVLRDFQKMSKAL
ncbi:MAG TPA: deoxyribodipyrimidine photo-lyase [Opitutales bacterium]|nr:deoxyribodipyrimidine photo-lyase [Opitutales bacterium]